MTAYLIAQLKIHDRDRYSRYEAGFMEIFERYDGALLAVDEAPEVLEGEWPHTRTVLIGFPSHEQARAWYQCDAYQQLAEHRREASVGNLVMVSSLPEAG